MREDALRRGAAERGREVCVHLVDDLIRRRAACLERRDDLALARRAVLEILAEQPRRVFEARKLEELAQSIRANGIIQPLVVRRAGERYQLVAGERRWRAARLCGRTSRC